MMRAILLRCMVLLALVGLPARAEGLAWASPPEQPEAGPGGRDYTYEDVRVTRYGEGADGYWVFEPRGADKATPLPVVLYVHGLNAAGYGHAWLWIRHLVRRGNLVVFPQYQQGLMLDQTTFTDKSAAAAAEALTRFDGTRHVLADRERFAIVGHSLGGTITANLAADHEGFGLPRPRAIMPVQPGDVKTDTGLGAFFPSIMRDHATIPAGTLMLVVATEDDQIVGTSVAKRIFEGAKNVAAEDKDFVLIHADHHGRPGLYADHLMPWAYIDRLGNERADAYDYALWRWFDALTDAAFHDGKNRRFALGNTPEQRHIGAWSDGQPIREPTVTDTP